MAKFLALPISKFLSCWHSCFIFFWFWKFPTLLHGKAPWKRIRDSRVISPHLLPFFQFANVCRSCFQIMSILPLCRWYTDGVFIFLGPWREWFWQTLSPWSPLSDNFMLRSSNAAKHNGTADLWAYHLEFWLLPFPVWYFPHRLFFYDPFHMSNPLTCLIYSSGKGTKICVCSRIAHWQPKVNLTPPTVKTELRSNAKARSDRRSLTRVLWSNLCTCPLEAALRGVCF